MMTRVILNEMGDGMHPDYDWGDGWGTPSAGDGHGHGSTVGLIYGFEDDGIGCGYSHNVIYGDLDGDGEGGFCGYTN